MSSIAARRAHKRACPLQPNGLLSRGTYGILAQMGPGAARNVGFKAAASDRILFLDNDVSLAPYCPDRLTEALDENPRAAVAMARILYAHHQEIIQYDGADSHFLGLMMLQNANKPCASATTQTRRIDSVVTACFLIDRCRWGDGDPFDEAFF